MRGWRIVPVALNRRFKVSGYVLADHDLARVLIGCSLRSKLPGGQCSYRSVSPGERILSISGESWEAPARLFCVLGRNALG